MIFLLRSISKKELGWLAKWVRSPYHNSNEFVIALFDYLRKYAPAFDSSRLHREKVYAHLFPKKKKYDDQRLRVLMFRLSSLIEEFLVAQRLKHSPLQHQQLLLEELGERNQYALFTKQNQELAEQLEQSPYRDEHYYLTRWRQLHDLFFHPQTARYHFSDHQLVEMMQQLDAFYVLSKLRYSAELRNRQNILPERYEIILLKKCLQLASEHPVFEKDPIFQAYRNILGLMEQPENETIYEHLENIAFEHLALFRPTDQSSLLRYLINTSIQLYQKGKPEYLNRQFKLYRLGLKKGLFLNEGQLSDTTFLNIIITATVLGEMTWTEAFIAQYAAMLPSDRQADAVSLGTAYWYFSKSNFTSSNVLLRQIESTNLQYLLRVKSLSLRNHFELFLQDDTYYTLLLSEAKAFEKFLRRNSKISKNRAQGYLNLSTFLRKLAKLKTSIQLTPERLDKMRRKIKKESALIAKPWLQEILERL